MLKYFSRMNSCRGVCEVEKSVNIPNLIFFYNYTCIYVIGALNLCKINNLVFQRSIFGTWNGLQSEAGAESNYMNTGKS